MPDTRNHRGLHPEDADLFAPQRQAVLRAAAADLSWLLERGYASDASLKLVADRYALRQRQRAAVGRGACAASTARSRAGKRVPSEHVIASADGAALDGCARWFNFARECVAACVPTARAVDLSRDPPGAPP